MERIAVDEARKNLEDVLLLVENGRQRVVLVDGEGEVCALVPVEDLELLENLDRDAKIPVERVPQEEVERHFRADVHEVRDREERIVVLVDGRSRAALIPRRDLKTLLDLDDRLDLEAAKRLLRKEMDGDSA